MTDINLNRKVQVELTTTGEVILEMTDMVDPNSHLPDSKNIRTFLLWELMAVFGPGLHMGCQIPFENNSMRIVPDE